MGDLQQYDQLTFMVEFDVLGAFDKDSNNISHQFEVDGMKRDDEIMHKAIESLKNEKNALMAKVSSLEDEMKAKDLIVSQLQQENKALKMGALSTDRFEQWTSDAIVHWIV